MTKTYTRNDVEYTVEACTAIALTAGDTERQNALHVHFVEESGEKFEYVVFGWTMDMLEDENDFDSMCDDSNAWDSDYETLATVRL